MSKMITLTRTRGKDTRTVELDASREGTINVLKAGGFVEEVAEKPKKKPGSKKKGGGKKPGGTEKLDGDEKLE